MICADGRITRFLAEGAFVSQEKESAILHDRAAQREPGLHPRIGRLIGVAERVGGLDVTVAQIAIDRAVPVVAARAADDVHHPAGGAAIFGGIAVIDDLKFLHRLLRYGGADAVDRVVHLVHAVKIHQIGASALPAKIDS